MALIQLTDALNDGNFKEYVDTESITRIQPYIKRSRKFGFFGSIKTELLGSTVYTYDDSDPTFVKETPEKIAELIKQSENTEQES